jgi:alpha-mannosidase
MASPTQFFDICKANVKDPLTWVGELVLFVRFGFFLFFPCTFNRWLQYFELHRGTYTTQAKNKLFNRKSELLLR